MTRSFALAALALSGMLGLSGPAAAQQADHLACMKVKDSATAGPIHVAISDVLEDEFSDCEVKKVRLTSLCVPIVKDAGDDPRGGLSAADAYGCYKVKCEGAADGLISVNDQFATRPVIRQKLTTICTPVDLP